MPGIRGFISLHCVAALAAPALLGGQAIEIDYLPIPASIPDAALHFGNLERLRGTQRILIPTLQVHVALEGHVYLVHANAASPARLSSGTAGGRRSTRLEYKLLGLGKERIQAAAAAAADELVDRLRARGFTVLTYDDIREITEVKKLPRMKPHREHDLPVLTVSRLDGSYAIVTPSDSQTFAQPRDGLHAQFTALARDSNATVLIPEIWVRSPQLLLAASDSAARLPMRGLLTNAAMTLLSAKADMYHPQHGLASITLNKEVPHISAAVGHLAEINVAASNRRITFAYHVTVAPEPFREGVLTGARLFHNVIVEKLSLAASKR